MNVSQLTCADSLKTDFYELTMAAGYFHNKVDLTATFELSCHSLSEDRSYLVMCGLTQILDYILNLRFSEEDIAFLKDQPTFAHVDQKFFDYLRDFRFSGDVWAMPEGEIFFAKEPVVQVTAPIIEAQILETFLLATMNIQSLVASKASRIVHAANRGGKTRGVIDFGSRRAHGPQAGILGARAAYIAGCIGTSNVFAGRQFGIPLYGTIAHSWVEAFENEMESFEKYYKAFPENTILLIDTFDTLKAAEKIKNLEFKDKIKAVRLDSGDLEQLSKNVRALFDKSGLKDIKIIASGNLNEYKIAELVDSNAPIDFFGVGTDMVVSRDCPALDLTYKLVQTENKGKAKAIAKRSPGKETIPGRKQVFREIDRKGIIQTDIIGLFFEKSTPKAQPLLKEYVRSGQLMEKEDRLSELREFAARRMATLPEKLKDLNKNFLYSPVLSKPMRETIREMF